MLGPIRFDAGVMSTADGPTSRTRLGRVLGTALSALWLFILVASLVSEPDPAIEEEDATVEGVVLAVLGLAAIAGFVLSLRRPLAGGVLTLVAGCLLCVFAVITAGRNQWLAVLVSGVPWIVVGGLVLPGRRRRADPPSVRRVGEPTDAV